jgi:hypothetical protein
MKKSDVIENTGGDKFFVSHWIEEKESDGCRSNMLTWSRDYLNGTSIPFEENRHWHEFHGAASFVNPNDQCRTTGQYTGEESTECFNGSIVRHHHLEFPRFNGDEACVRQKNT